MIANFARELSATPSDGNADHLSVDQFVSTAANL
jgi:hypothetical protein